MYESRFIVYFKMGCSPMKHIYRKKKCRLKRLNARYPTVYYIMLILLEYFIKTV